MKDPIIVNSPSVVYNVTKKYRNKEQEHFVVITLDGANQVIKVHTVTIGLVNQTLIHPREIFRPAIKDNAVAVILVHNHPSGKITPSQQDRNITDRIEKAGEILGISVLDHVIISKNGFNSYQEGWSD